MNIRKPTIHFLLSASLLIGLAAVTPQKVSAQFAVFDASSWAEMGQIWNEDVNTNIKLAQELQQGMMLFNQTMQIYNLAMQETQFLQHGKILQAIGFAAQHSQIPGHPQWDLAMTSVQGGAFMANAWQQMVNPHLSLQNRINLADSVATDLLMAMGSCNAAAAANSNQFSGLETMIADMTPGGNTRANQMNLMNQGIEFGNRNAQCQANVQQQMAKVQMLHLAAERDRDQAAMTTFSNATTNMTNNPMYETDPTIALYEGMN